ncbi:unnamed protein product [Adineta steineri]|uniref:NmrA-like domain-containing protein n=1 Tax=Adineta steineri TaxID=433720 RepID=A0A814T4Y7_9BILA|nr:unnamed protein product [Adineta steineri]CAF3856713.1 unnamed protein product [Adineta steineri]
MSTNTYKNIILLGAAGDTGKHILPALLADSTFNVIILSRADSNATFSSNVKVIKVNYSDKNALTKALVGQDVLISTVGGEGLHNDFGTTLVQAAIDAGVKWFIPSEFGADYADPICTTIPPLAGKLKVINLLKENQSRISHTFISTGMFLNWGFDNGFFGFDVLNRTVTLFDDGKGRVSGTSLPNITKAVVATIHHPEVSLNKRIYIADATFTQEEVLSLFEKYTDTKWTVKHVSTKDLQKRGDEKIAKGNIKDAFYDYIKYLIYGGHKVCIFEGRTSNKDLGIPTTSLDQIVKEALQRNN